jgi:dihydrofolate synthase/folylpolyglutamate synthase
LNYNYKSEPVHLITDQLGSYQKNNCRTVFTAVEALRRLGFPNISENFVQMGLQNTSHLTGLKGRWQILQEQPKVIADTGHNVDGIRQIVDQLEQEKFETLRMVIGFVNDKKVDDVLQILPHNAVYYFTQADIPRAMNAEMVKNLAEKYGLKGEYYNKTSQALAEAKKQAHNEDLIFIGGSTFVVSELV